MNWLAFWASIIGSLAWPATIIVALLIFRKQLLAAVPGLTQLELGSLKLKFAEGLVQAKASAEKIEETPAQAPAPPPGVPDVDLLLAVNAPRALVMESWFKVEQALAAAIARHGLQSSSSAGMKPPPSPGPLIRHGIITDEIADTIKYLRKLRNDAAHLPTFAIETEQALEYARLARRVVDALTQEPPTAAIGGL